MSLELPEKELSVQVGFLNQVIVCDYESALSAHSQESNVLNHLTTNRATSHHEPVHTFQLLKQTVT